MSEFAYLFRVRERSAFARGDAEAFRKMDRLVQGPRGKGVSQRSRPSAGSARCVVKSSQKIVTDGPYAEAKDVVGGYIVVEARDLAQAVDLAKGCPILDVGGSVEVRATEKIHV